MAGNVRRIWDKEAYAIKAKERAALGEAEEGNGETEITAKKPKADELKEEFRPAEEGAAGPMGSARAFIKPREKAIDTEQNVGRTQIVSAAAMEAGVGAGFWCEVCSCLLKDSAGYLDHVNGKKHQRALGFSMRVERVGADVVKSRLEALKRKIVSVSSGGGSGSSSGSSSGSGDGSSSSSNGSSSNGCDDAGQAKDPAPSALAQLDQSVGSRVLEEEARKKQRKVEAEARRQEREAVDMEEADPEIAALMGFGGFGGGKKR